LGDATKIVRYLSDCEKEYRAVMKLGEETDTQDLTGHIIQQVVVPEYSQADITCIFDQFRGDIEQIPPMYSARRVQGKRLYKLARQGKTVAREAQRVHILSLDILDSPLPFIQFRVVCSKGTYIRTLAHDIGKAFGCGAHLTELERTRIGAFQLADAYRLDRLSEHISLQTTLTPLDRALAFFPEVILSEAQSQRLIHGAYIDEPLTPNTGADNQREPETQMVRVYDTSGTFIALAQKTFSQQKDGLHRQFRPVRVFAK
jgi:tRNA pseudouridine55 synthase